MSPDPNTRASRLRENTAEAHLAILRNRVEQHVASVGKTPQSLISRSEEAVRSIDKIIKQLRDCANGDDDIDLKALVAQLEDEFVPIKNRMKWHDQQIAAFAPLRDALADTELPEEEPDAEDG